MHWLASSLAKTRAFETLIIYFIITLYFSMPHCLLTAYTL